VYTERVGGSSPSPPTMVPLEELAVQLRFTGLIAVALLAGLAAAVSGAPASAMTFRIVPLAPGEFCGHGLVQVIAAEGEITEQTAQDFVAFANENMGTQPRNVLFLDSPGGNVVGALEFGKILRRLRTAVVIAKVIPLDDRGAVGIAAGRCMS